LIWLLFREVIITHLRAEKCEQARNNVLVAVKIFDFGYRRGYLAEQGKALRTPMFSETIKIYDFANVS